MATIPESPTDDLGAEDQLLFTRIANDLRDRGYSVCPEAINPVLLNGMAQKLASLGEVQFKPAGIGRRQAHRMNESVRSDNICWITAESQMEQNWLNWSRKLQSFLNRRLYLGLFSFESHFAHYEAGAFYKRHLDAFRGETTRVLSLVVYLNPDWGPADGGELVLYLEDTNQQRVSVLPMLGTLVVFLSEEFEHEVLPAKRDRYSIAGWFRVNPSALNSGEVGR